MIEGDKPHISFEAYLDFLDEYWALFGPAGEPPETKPERGAYGDMRL
jgi:hypothetical protein